MAGHARHQLGDQVVVEDDVLENSMYFLDRLGFGPVNLEPRSLGLRPSPGSGSGFTTPSGFGNCLLPKSSTVNAPGSMIIAASRSGSGTDCTP